MKIGKVIFTHRKARNMTQEELAEILGVSVPAVSKWETNVSMPDISMLAPIARVFHITIDQLLSFQYDLTEDEINQILKEIQIISEEQGVEEAIKYADTMLHQYSNSEKLRLETAFRLSSLSQSMVLHTEKITLYQTCKDRVIKLFEELVNSDDFYIGNAAKTGLASSYMSCGRLDEAEMIFEQMKLPEEWNSKRILPSVYMMKQEYDKAFLASEKNLMEDWQNMVIDMRSIYNILLGEKEYDRAFEIARTVDAISEYFGSWLNNGMDMILEVYLLKKDMDHALPAFERYIDKLIRGTKEQGYRQGAALFFQELNDKSKEETTKEEVKLPKVNILQIMYQAISMDAKYDILREYDGYQKAMKSLEQNM